MNVAIVGGGINGLCCAWQLAKDGYKVHLYERDKLMNATSRASSKLLHGGLRYLENGEIRLVRESLQERDAWLRRVPELAKPLRLILPIYKDSRRPAWVISLGLALYDRLAGQSLLPRSARLAKEEILRRDSRLNPKGLLGGYEFSDGQMDDYALGQWVAAQGRKLGVTIVENAEIQSVSSDGHLTTVAGDRQRYDRVLNVAGPWAHRLLEQSDIHIPYGLDLIRGSHLVLAQPCPHAYLLEVPFERRIFFVLPWKGQTLLGTTEVRQSLDTLVTCSEAERNYLLSAYLHYFPDEDPQILESFAGLRPLIYSAKDPNKATREYVIYTSDKLVTVLGGKWTTAAALARKVSQAIH